MAATVTHTPIFERLSSFSLAPETSSAPQDADAAPAPPPRLFSLVAGFDDDEEPIMDKLSGLRSLSVSTDASDSRGELCWPPTPLERVSSTTIALTNLRSGPQTTTSLLAEGVQNCSRST